MGLLIVSGLHDYFSAPGKQWLSFGPASAPQARAQLDQTIASDIDRIGISEYASPLSAPSTSVSSPPANVDVKTFYDRIAQAKQRRASRRAELSVMTKNEEQNYVALYQSYRRHRESVIENAALTAALHAVRAHSRPPLNGTSRASKAGAKTSKSPGTIAKKGVSPATAQRKKK